MQCLTDFSRSSQMTLCRFEVEAVVDVWRCNGAGDTGLSGTAHSKSTASVKQNESQFSSLNTASQSSK